MVEVFVKWLRESPGWQGVARVFWVVARGFLFGPSKKCILQCASVGFFSSILFNGTLRKRYKSCHWGSTLSKVICIFWILICTL